MIQSVAALVIFASSYMAWYLERFETKMVYPFDSTYATPVEAGEPRLVESWFEQADGTKVVVWTAQAATGKPTILYFSGNAGNLQSRVARFSIFLDAGYGLVAPAYRGSSGSEGAPDEAALTADALAIAAPIAAQPLVLYGESLGSALAVKLAAQGIGDAVVLEAPFTSIVDVVEVQFPLDELSTLLTQRWISLDHAPAVEQPLLVVHGTEDRIVPIELGLRIFNAFGSVDKTFLKLDGHGHTGLWTPEMRDALVSFLEDL